MATRNEWNASLVELKDQNIDQSYTGIGTEPPFPPQGTPVIQVGLWIFGLMGIVTLGCIGAVAISKELSEAWRKIKGHWDL